MTHQTNGASLEDCHTNFFALTDLCGIKWRKFVHGESGFAPEPTEDPVLSSFSRCLANDILCVWRRVATAVPQSADINGGGGGGIFDNIPLPAPPTKQPPLSLHAAKELWIFWYGEEPDLSGLVAPELLTSEGAQGSWENGLSYECRSLLFKALHNLIERCLLSRDCVRLGKFFVQPHDAHDKVSGKNGYLSFSFAFFVHGESTVCASVDVREHPSVYSLARQHLAAAQTSSNGTPVILAPHGLAGSLTGVAFKNTDAATSRFLEEWRQFYPIHNKFFGRDTDTSLPPPVVEVLVGGVKMKYPSCYVLVTDIDDPAYPMPLPTTCLLGKSSPNITNKLSSGPASPPCSPCPKKRKALAANRLQVPPEYDAISSGYHTSSMHRNSSAAVRLPEWVWQDSIAGQLEAESTEQPQLWTFNDPIRKANCSCSKCKKTQTWKLANTGANVRRVPFHRRPDDYFQAPRTRPTGSVTPCGGPPSYHRGQSMTPNPVPTLLNNGLNDSLPVPSVGSPASAAPSPLPNPHSQPASIPPTDPTMPTLSPHPPNQPSTPHEKNTPAATPDPNPNPKSVSSLNQTFSPYPNSVDHKHNISSENIPPPSSNILNNTNSTIAAIKRPVLSSKEYENAVLDEEIQPSDLLYDYSTLDAWLNHPVKKFKTDIREVKRKVYFGGDLYNIHQPNRAPSPPLPPQIKMEIKEEPTISPMLDNDMVSQHHLGDRPDPYEFNEDMNANNDEDRANGPTKLTSGNLYTNEGLTASYRDLDQIFDNSDDTSSDEPVPVQVPTPPNSNKSSGFTEDNSQIILVKPPRGSGGTSHGGILRPEELCKMFPTPPSMDHNPMSSPGGQLSDGQVGDLSDGPIRFKQEIYPEMGSPQEEIIEDWSYVFKPPFMYKMVGSTKYAPLSNLPSQGPLPSQCIYKPSWLHPPPSSSTTSSSSTTVCTTTTAAAATTTTTTTATTSSDIKPIVPTVPTRAVQMSPACSPIMPMMYRKPPPYEMPSPATSTASSYLNKNLNSVEPLVSRAPEANSLVVNILLSDTALNIFRDHNFDSCTLCVCNAGVKCVGNIRGADAGFYLQSHALYPPISPPPWGHHEDEAIRCNCGFSAVVNRRLSHKAGLFYEDELEITGIAEDPNDRRKSQLHSYVSSLSRKTESGTVAGVSENIDIIPQNVLEIVREQCVVVQSGSNSLHRAAKLFNCTRSVIPYCTTVNVLEYTDSNDVVVLALEQGRVAMESSAAMCRTDEYHARHKNHPPSIHRWPFLRARGPRCSQDIVRIMKSLQPVLQEAIQKKCTTRLWEAPYTVSGPLTWRQFHRLAGRGTEDRCEPQPIPSLLVGYEKDWLALSPYALHYWDKLLLEPFSYSRDIAYIVVSPDHELVIQKVKTFFRELSSTYEMCRLGRHSPITKVLRDGILRVGKSAAAKLAKEPVEDYFQALGESPVCNLLRLYAQVCRHHLGPYLSQVTIDKTLLDPPEGLQRPTPSPMPPPTSFDPSGLGSIPEKAPSTPKSEDTDSLPTSSANSYPSDMNHDEEDTDPPAVVIYLVEPFTMASDDPDLQRLTCLSLLRCFTAVLSSVPEHIRSNIVVQIISLESIMELGKSRDRNHHNDHMRALALSVFSQCKRILVHNPNVKSLTGFGTAAMTEHFLKRKDEKNRAPYHMYSPPYILAKPRNKVESSESFGQPNAENSSVLYVSYCLSEDQRWLLAVCTDDTGSTFQTTMINIEIPNRSRRKKASARRVGLQKLMDFILGVISQTVQPWRLVVGRIGRIGHGELKGWSWLLSRKCLLKASKHLRELCNQCSILATSDVPCILSACLVSLEPDSMLRLMPDQFTPDERFSQNSVNCQLSTPQDVSCTHILVFPTSATTQSSQIAFQERHINTDLNDDELFSALNDDDMPEGIDGMQDDFNDIFSTWPDNAPGGVQSPTGSPRRLDSPSQQDSESCGMGGNLDQRSPFPCNGASRGGGGEPQEEVGTLLQQPLALGYLVSTAPTGQMPPWFWASCPHLENVCPAFLKNALHMHSPAIQQSSEDLLQQQSAVTVHPLDSQFTTDVLRHVLEGYNALSWLALDSNTHDRLSCLPVHIQVLMQLYHMTTALV